MFIYFFEGRIAGYATEKRKKQAFLNIKNGETNDMASSKKIF